MVLAALNDNLYRLFFVLHIVSVVVAFSAAVVNPVLMARTMDDDEAARIRVGSYLALNGKQIHFPALVLVGLFGLAMVFSSDEAWAFDQLWVSLALLIWLTICGIVSGLLLPAERRFGAGDVAAEARIAIYGQAITVLTLVMLYLMVWKPGL